MTHPYSKLLLAAVPAALCACITVEAPAGEDEQREGDAGVLEEDVSGDGADAGERRTESSMRERAESSTDASTADVRDDGETGDARRGTGDGSAGEDDENTGGEDEQRYYCGILRTTIRICNGTRDTSYGESCVQDEVDCLAVLPPDERVDHSEYCYTRTEYRVFAGEAQPGTCELFEAYWNDEVECLLDSHCGEGERCEANACVCPDGVACQCPYCGPQPARCDGDVLVELVGSGPCDENRQCVYEEQTTDCAAMGLACDALAARCGEPAEPPGSAGGTPGTPGDTPGPSPSP